MKRHCKLTHIAVIGCSICLILASCSTPDVASIWEPRSETPPKLSPLEFKDQAEIPAEILPAGLPEEKTTEVPAIKPDSVKTTSNETTATKETTPTVAADGKQNAITEKKKDVVKPIITDIRGAAFLALQNNPSFQMERFGPALQQTYEEQQRAAFDPTVSGELNVSRTNSDTDSETLGVGTDTRKRDLSRTGKLGISQTLPTGTSIELSGQRSLNNSRGDPADNSNYDDLKQTNNYDITVTQSLLRGFGPKVNLASLRLAKLDTEISKFIFKAAAENLVYQTESTAWDYILAQKRIQIYEDSLKIAEEQLSEAKERIKVGALADIELAAVEAEVATSKEDLINARSDLSKTRLELFRLLGMGGSDRWTREITLTNSPKASHDKLASVEQHVAVAMERRSDINEARLKIKQGELNVVRTKNGLLPKLDFFISLGDNRYASSFGTTNKDEDGLSHEYVAGLRFEHTIGNRSEKASHRQSVISLHKVEEALKNQKDLAQVDVRTAYLEVLRTAKQIDATAATRKHREQVLHSESEKFRVGKSTSILVAQAQRDLVSSRIAEIEAIIDQIKARLNLYLQEGSILERRGIDLQKK